jgi:uncharacterized membrane protein
MGHKSKYYTLLAIFFICFVSSAVLSFIPAEQACGGVKTTCYAVQTSGYENIVGTKNSYFGLIIFGVLSFLTATHISRPKKYKKTLIFLGTVAGSLVALYFIYLQFFKIESLCKYCMVIDVGTLLGLGILLFWKERRP